MTHPLDVSPLRKAFEQLKRSLAALESEQARNDAALHQIFRAAAIQAFELTHELAFKMLRRQLDRMNPDPEAVGKMTYMEIVRSGAAAGLILDVGRFKDYREKRNVTSHTYDEEKAELLAGSLHTFAGDVEYLLAELEKRNRGTD